MMDVRHSAFRLDGVEMGQPLTKAERAYVAMANVTHRHHALAPFGCVTLGAWGSIR